MIKIMLIARYNLTKPFSNVEAPRLPSCSVQPQSGLGSFSFIKDNKMKRIPLTRNQFALVDDEDYKELSKHKWYFNRNKKNCYAHRQYRDSERRNKKGLKKQVVVLMHRQIMNAPKGISIDHINHNGLDNRRQNLRFSTHSQNLQNQRVKEEKYKGIGKSPDGKKWQVIIAAKGVKHYLGMFTHAETAAREYDKLAKLLHGEFACLNFPERNK